MAAVSLVAGARMAIPLSSPLNGLLFGVEPVDLPTIGGAAVLLLGVALVVSWIPARSATDVDPVIALTTE